MRNTQPSLDRRRLKTDNSQTEPRQHLASGSLADRWRCAPDSCGSCQWDRQPVASRCQRVPARASQPHRAIAARRHHARHYARCRRRLPHARRTPADHVSGSPPACRWPMVFPNTQTERPTAQAQPGAPRSTTRRHDSRRLSQLPQRRPARRLPIFFRPFGTSPARPSPGLSTRAHRAVPYPAARSTVPSSSCRSFPSIEGRPSSGGPRHSVRRRLLLPGSSPGSLQAGRLHRPVPLLGIRLGGRLGRSLAKPLGRGRGIRLFALRRKPPDPLGNTLGVAVG